jgi:hypothetical protein
MYPVARPSKLTGWFRRSLSFPKFDEGVSYKVFGANQLTLICDQDGHPLALNHSAF